MLREVELLLNQGRAVGAKPLREYNEVQGYADAARWVYGQALEPDAWNDGRLITIAGVRHIHYAAMTPVWDVAPHPEATDKEGPGNYREHDIASFAEGMTPPKWPLVPARVEQWVSEVCAFGQELKGGAELDQPLPEILAGIHNRFERIHPFLDGNGRTGRLVMNLVLVRLGYPPIVIFKRQRDAYLSALRRADSGDCGALGELVARAMEDNLNRFIVPDVAGPARLVPLAALADAEHSLAALRQAAQRGRLSAVQGPDGVWRSSRKSVAAYSANKHQRRPSAGDA